MLQKAAAKQTMAVTEVEDTRNMWESEHKSRSLLSSKIAQLEEQKQEVEAQLCEMKRKAKKALELKKAAEVRGCEAQEKVNQLHREVLTLRTQLKSCKKLARDAQSGGNDKANNLENHPRDETDNAGCLRQQLLGLAEMRRAEASAKHQLQRDLRGLERAYARLERSNAKLQTDLDNQQATNSSDRNELEKQMRLELNAKLVEVNNFLADQEKARDDIDRLRDSREADMRKNFENSRRALEEEMQQLQWRYRETITTLEERNRELLRVKELYETEVQCRDRLLYQSVDKRPATTPAPITAPVLPSYSIPFTGVGWTPGSAPVMAKSDTDLVDMQLLQELDRSITRHLEKEPKIDIDVPQRLGHTLADSDLHKSSTEYLNTLKRNYFV
ncbi:hypothetical protein NP493_154g05001 [Ridgeia piscesae]|uniref:Uncharacterized protein n=1 Tax=Ridgeia piscesae TaxID=27915 RepID=A0AAD9UFU0_RIDPI|nr:hypothetical protein NP493_154g05001 [Ridgeia piscesae]